MDPLAIGYYAAICAALGLLSPYLGGAIPRILAGIAVGMAAASALPVVKTVLIGG